MLRTRLFSFLNTSTDVLFLVATIYIHIYVFIYMYAYMYVYLKIESAKHKLNLTTTKKDVQIFFLNQHKEKRRIFYHYKE